MCPCPFKTSIWIWIRIQILWIRNSDVMLIPPCGKYSGWNQNTAFWNYEKIALKRYKINASKRCFFINKATYVCHDFACPASPSFECCLSALPYTFPCILWLAYFTCRAFWCNRWNLSAGRHSPCSKYLTGTVAWDFQIQFFHAFIVLRPIHFPHTISRNGLNFHVPYPPKVLTFWGIIHGKSSLFSCYTPDNAHLPVPHIIPLKVNIFWGMVRGKASARDIATKL